MQKLEITGALDLRDSIPQRAISKKALYYLRESSVLSDHLSEERIELFLQGRSPATKDTSGTRRNVGKVLSDLLRGEKPQNAYGCKQVSNGLYRAMENPEFRELSGKVRRKIKRWHRETGARVPQSGCSSLEVKLKEQKDLLDSYGVDFSRIRPEQLGLKLTSKDKISLSYGCCGEFVERSIDSFVSAINAAANGRGALKCPSCVVATGQLELKIREFFEGSQASVTPQFCIENQPNLPYDLLVVSPSGVRTLVEIDGGWHWGEAGIRTPRQNMLKLQSDKLKTELALRKGYRMLRIDERKTLGLMNQEIREACRLVANGENFLYDVLGEECPGAAAASSELKGKRPPRIEFH